MQLCFPNWVHLLCVRLVSGLGNQEGSGHLLTCLQMEQNWVWRA